jgi:glycosyltransferase involved in cell wall biosynthesis
VRKIRVLRIINRFNIGGPTYNATFLSKFLGDEYETMLVGGYPEKGESDSLFILDNYGVKPILIKELKRDPNLKSDARAYRRLKKIIKEFSPDIVHTHAAKAGAIGRRAAYACGVPVIVHTFHGHIFHSYFGKIKTKIFKTIERKLAKKSDGIIAISELQKKELSETHKICTLDKITVIPLGFDLKPFVLKRESERRVTRDSYGIGEDEIAIAIVGRLAPIKNHRFFINSIEEVFSKTKKKLKIFIVGDGPEWPVIKSQVDRINEIHGNRIVMTSWIKDIGSFNAGMDIICLTSKNEGTPVSLIEAQAANIPVITTDVGGVRDIIKHDETGIIVANRSVEEYSDSILELVENEKKRNFLSQNGWDYVEDKFHYTTLVKNMDAYYKTLLEDKGVEWEI